MSLSIGQGETSIERLNKEYPVKSILLRLVFGAVTLASATGADGCSIGWGTGNPPPPTGSYTKASSVNVVNCQATSDPFAHAYAVYYHVGFSQWIYAGQASTQFGAACDGYNVQNADPGSIVPIYFDSGSDYTIRAIEIDFGDPYGAPATCDSSTGAGTGCTGDQIREMKYTADQYAGTATFGIK